MIGELSQGEMTQLLATQHIGRLGIYGDDSVYVFPIAYGYDGRNIYLFSHEGTKTRLMRAHPRVCFEVEEIASPTQWRTVMAHGEFEELTEPGARDLAFLVIGSQGRSMLPPSTAPYRRGIEHIVVYRIRVTEMTGRFEYDEVFRPAAPHTSPARAGEQS